MAPDFVAEEEQAGTGGPSSAQLVTQPAAAQQRQSSGLFALGILLLACYHVRFAAATPYYSWHVCYFVQTLVLHVP